MPLSLLLKWKARRLKLRVWNRRIQERLRALASESEFSPVIACSAQVYWGPYYGGSLIVDRKLRSARIIVQIPYDGHLTANERQILGRYSIRKSMLPEFIFYHEAAHLLDMLPYIGRDDLAGLKRYVAEHRQMASEAQADYRNLPFEEQADRYAYTMLTRNCMQAG